MTTTAEASRKRQHSDGVEPGGVATVRTFVASAHGAEAIVHPSLRRGVVLVRRDGELRGVAELRGYRVTSSAWIEHELCKRTFGAIGTCIVLAQ